MNPTLAPGLRHEKGSSTRWLCGNKDTTDQTDEQQRCPGPMTILRQEPNQLHTSYCRWQVSFGFEFDHALAGVEWPPGLESVVFGFRFNKPLDDAHWPAALSQLSLGESFNLPLQNVRCVFVCWCDIRSMYQGSNSRVRWRSWWQNQW